MDIDHQELRGVSVDASLMPLYRTNAEGVTGLGVNCEIPDVELARMSAGEVFERLAAEYWSEFYKMAGIDPADEDLERTYQRAFLQKPLITH